MKKRESSGLGAMDVSGFIAGPARDRVLEAVESLKGNGLVSSSVVIVLSDSSEACLLVHRDSFGEVTIRTVGLAFVDMEVPF